MQRPSQLRDWTIYKITSPTNRVYIGITSNLNSRLESYKNCGKRLYKQTLIYNSVRKYGYSSHSVEIIDVFNANSTDSAGKEMYWIRSFMSNKNKFPEQNGLNLTDGGDGTIGSKHTEEAKEKNRQAHLGKKQSSETIEKRRKKSIGVKKNFTHFTPEFRKQMSERQKGYKHTEDAKKKIGEASKGNKYRLGSKMTAEQIQHRSSLLRGRKVPQHIKEKRIKTFIERHGKPILVFNLNGKLLKEYAAASIAANELKIPRLGICRVLNGTYYQSRGYIFKYKK